MAKVKKESFFWASYSDLMTSLFFVMLVLFVLAIALLGSNLRKVKKEGEATKAQMDKVKEIENAINTIDSAYFDYSSKFKKHILRIQVNFPIGSSTLNTIDKETLSQLHNAGIAIERFIQKVTHDYPVQYLLIIEGQASRDRYARNYELSYERALALKRFWDGRNIHFGRNCEVLISGSGDGNLSGTDFMRESYEPNNQRFLIHIIPKPGIIEDVSKSN